MRYSYRDTITNEYFEWLVKKISVKPSSRSVSYNKLLQFLHTVEFRWCIDHDENRAEDGINMRWRFAVHKGHEEDSDEILDILEGPCSVLEMMVALAIRCEDIMDDPSMGDRTPQWFWSMITNLGLGSMHDDKFDKERTGTILNRFMDRMYKPNGRGGLFRLRSCDTDLRDVEIWYQMCWYLDTIM